MIEISPLLMIVFYIAWRGDPDAGGQELCIEIQ